MRRLAVLSLHTSPLAQPGAGDGGGMNVYVRELSSSLARAGVECDVYTRAWSPDLSATVLVEPGFRVHHVPAGPLAHVAKEDLADLVGEFTDTVTDMMESGAGIGRPAGRAVRFDAIHANYWLSGLAGHTIKHRLDIPLVSTFHTLDRVKAELDPQEIAEGDPAHRALAESEVMGCSEIVLASCQIEADQLTDLYGVDPVRIRIVPPGVDHAFFGPGDRSQARRALGLPAGGPLLLFVGRIQPLKGLEVAIEALSLLDRHQDATLVVVGGPSGTQGESHLAHLIDLVDRRRLSDRVRFVSPQRHELLSTFYRAADLCLVPSRSESFGLVALEAAACGTPVVASAVGGLNTLVDDGETGFLIDSRSPADFAQACDQILSHPEVAGAMSRAAAAKSRNYTWLRACELLRSTYGELSDRRLAVCR